MDCRGIGCECRGLGECRGLNVIVGELGVSVGGLGVSVGGLGVSVGGWV